MSTFSGQKLYAVVHKLESFAPTTYAEQWDNVGLLIEPYEERDIRKILLTNDLTEPVVKEAIEKKIDFIISYHPPIFKPLTRITKNNWKERIVAGCLANSIALYSPHTAWDKVEGGVNDWLVSCIAEGSAKPIITEMGAPAGTGSGRYVEVSAPVSVLVRKLQEHIQNDVHVAFAVGHHSKTQVKSVAVCAGSGASMLRGVKADLVITGEMSHHELLDFNHNGTTVLLCNHSNSERGFLYNFKHTLAKLLENTCEVIVSEVDRDPLSTIVRSAQSAPAARQA